MDRRGQRRRALGQAELLAVDGIVSPRALRPVGVTRAQLEAQLSARRWQRTGARSLAVRTGPLSPRARWRVALLEVGPRAALAGVTALQAAGLTGVEEPVLHVIVPKSADPGRPPGVRVHESRRFAEADVLPGLRRQRPAVAAVHAALWARTDRQAALFVVAAVQQRLAPAEEVGEVLTRVTRHRRRRLLERVVADLRDGAQSLGELDLAAGLRRRGLPQPARQVVRRLSSGRVYLDADWDRWQVCMELDGEGHTTARARVADALRDLEVAATGRTVLRVPLLAYRLDEQGVLERLAAVLRSRGWSGEA